MLVHALVRIKRGPKTTFPCYPIPIHEAQIKIIAGKTWYFCYLDYILQIKETGRGISMSRNLKALLNYKKMDPVNTQS